MKLIQRLDSSNFISFYISSSLQYSEKCYPYWLIFVCMRFLLCQVNFGHHLSILHIIQWSTFEWRTLCRPFGCLEKKKISLSPVPHQHHLHSDNSGQRLKTWNRSGELHSTHHASDCISMDYKAVQVDCAGRTCQAELVYCTQSALCQWRHRPPWDGIFGRRGPACRNILRSVLVILLEELNRSVLVQTVLVILLEELPFWQIFLWNSADSKSCSICFCSTLYSIIECSFISCQTLNSMISHIRLVWIYVRQHKKHAVCCCWDP